MDAKERENTIENSTLRRFKGAIMQYISVTPIQSCAYILAIRFKRLAHTYAKFCKKADGVIGFWIGWVAVDGWMIFVISQF